MKLTLAIVVVCLSVSSVKSGYFGGWTPLDTCTRPSDGECSLAGSCCGKKLGTLHMERECLGGGSCHFHDLSMLTKSVKCNINCRDEQTTAFTSWRSAGDCKRPTSGDCALAGTCCGQTKGVMDFERECIEEGKCLPAALKRTRRCNLRCSREQTTAFTAWKSAGECKRPSSGECALAGTCCGQPKGDMEFERECVVKGKCLSSALKMSRKCSIRCDAEQRVAFTPWERTPAGCERPASGDCALVGSCCGQNKGTMKYQRECAEKGKCLTTALEKIRPCRIKCRFERNMYTAWERAGNCERPTSGNCAADGTCCGQNKGTMDFTRECKVAGKCHPRALQRTKRCSLRCGVVHPCDVFPNPCENGGICNKLGDSHSCTCKRLWTGHHCTERVTAGDITPATRGKAQAGVLMVEMPPPEMPPADNVMTCRQPNIRKGSTDCDARSVAGDKCIVTCDAGYAVSGNPNLECGDDGEFGTLPTCEEITCEKPAIRNGAVSCDPTSAFGGTCPVKCNIGYVIRGNPNIVCGDSNNDGIGDFGTLPTCERED